jgi:hypothetical protein
MHTEEKELKKRTDYYIRDSGQTSKDRKKRSYFKKKRELLDAGLAEFKPKGRPPLKSHHCKHCEREFLTA